MNRRFFTSHGAAGLLLATTHVAWSKAENWSFKALGACSPLKNAEAIKAAGGNYVEESVGRFLNPNQTDAEWRKKLAEAKASPLPILACNNFIPGSLKSTGKDANQDRKSVV